MLPLLRPYPPTSCLTNMPVAGPQTYQSQIPSFMSIYGYNNVPNLQQNHLVESPSEVTESKERSREDDREHILKHKHRDSTSTQASTTSESTDSSPTTTISTADSSALTDPSPSSPPESPVNLLPLSSFASTNFGINSLDHLAIKTMITENYDRPMTSPTFRKPRNAKGLALKLGGDNLLQASAPASPMNFAVGRPPAMKPRRKPSNLTLQTNSNFHPLPPLCIEPPTPGQRLNTMHHSASMSQLSMFSPDPRAGGPPGGMRLPSFERSTVSGLSNTFRKPPPIMEMTPGGSQEWREEPDAIRTQLASRSDGDIGGDSFDCAGNEDLKSPGYPDGPIQIYEPHVYLYLEPTAEEASKFDVIMNVASEVKNPFAAKAAEKERKPSIPSTFDLMDIDRDNIPEPMTAATCKTYKTAWEFVPMDNQTPTADSPTTPKPPAKQPEYIHIPWEHNTDITKDLMHLCEAIDDRVNKGKKVLIHCQQGASRSASLIIAYGMYRNPSLTVDAAYNAAQARSKYISPNINLMYALQDFRKTLQHKSPKNGRSPAKHRMALSVDEIDFPRNEPPQTAPLPTPANGPNAPENSLLHARGNSTPNLREISPGPSSAPSAFPWPSIDKNPKAEEKKPEVKSWNNTPTDKIFTNFDFAKPKRPSPNASPTEFFTPVNAVSNSFLSVDTPPNSQPTSPPAPSMGFSEHRSKRKPAPSLTFKPVHPLRPVPSLPSVSDSNIRERVVTMQGNMPDTPGLWSPRLQEMAGPAISIHQNTQTSFGFSSLREDDMPPPPLPLMAAPNPHMLRSFSEQPPRTTEKVFELPKLELEGVMSPKQNAFEISPFREVMDMDVLGPELSKVTSKEEPADILQKLPKKKSFLFERTPEGRKHSMRKPLPPLPLGLGMGTQRRRVERVVDPRSPPLRGEGGVVRSIDDVLQ